MNTGRNRPAKIANPPRLWSCTSCWASWAIAMTNTRSKKSSSQDAWRSSADARAAVRSRGGLSHTLRPLDAFTTAKSDGRAPRPDLPQRPHDQRVHRPIGHALRDRPPDLRLAAHEVARLRLLGRHRCSDHLGDGARR